MPPTEFSIPNKFLERKDLGKTETYHIFSFEEIGMFDPFPNEHMDVNFYVPTAENDLVYRGTRYVKGNSPNCIYFPCNKLLFKLMRACIGVTHPDFFWF